MPESVVVVDPKIMNGTPCFRGTRVPFKSLIDYLKGGHALGEFLAQFPSVSRELAIQALEEAKDALFTRIGWPSAITRSVTSWAPRTMTNVTAHSGTTISTQRTIISVDLAARRYRDIGVAVIGHADETVSAEFKNLGDAGLKGTPSIEALVQFLTVLAQDTHAVAIFIDGPQGWKHPDNGLIHARSCEQRLSTPGKTGLPGTVKPAPWTRMAVFSIQLFDALSESGYPRLQGQADLTGLKQIAIESFPTSAWKSLGLKPLSGKPASDSHIQDQFNALTALVPISVARPPTHDELQALIGGLAGLSLLGKTTIAPAFIGTNPVWLDGTCREGFILNPILTSGQIVAIP